VDERHVGFLEADKTEITLLPIADMPIPPAPAIDEALSALTTLFECCGISSAARTVADLIHHFGSVVSLLKASVEEIVLRCEMSHELASLVAAFGRLHHATLAETLKERLAITSFDALSQFALNRLRGGEVEEVILLLLDRKSQLIREQVLRTGSVDHVGLYPREIVRLALLYNASAVILVHNHPSGDATPSRQDVEMTRTIAASLASLGIALHEHLIVGANQVIGIKASGLL